MSFTFLLTTLGRLAAVCIVCLMQGWHPMTPGGGNLESSRTRGW